MKKLLSILGTVSLTATGTSNIIACQANDWNNDKQEKENNDDIKTWNKLQVEAKNMFLNELKKEDMVYQINDSTLYSEVSNTNQSKNVNLTGTENNIITQVIENKLDKINNKIKTEYNNFYYNSEPIKIIQKTFTINYIDPKAYSIINNINVNAHNVKGIKIIYDLQFELTYKNITNNFNHKFNFIITTNKNFILNKISQLVNYIKTQINDFYDNQNNSKIKLDDLTEYNNLKGDIDIFDNTQNTKLVNKYNNDKFLSILKTKLTIETEENNLKIDNNFLISENNTNKDIFNMWRDFTAKNQKVKTEKDILEENHLSKWLFNDNNLKNNGDDFVNFYYNENTIENELKINSFSINLNAISIFGLPLINKPLNNQINFYISKQSFKDIIKEFGNLIYNFFKYFDTKLNNDKTITLKVELNIYDKLKNNDKKSQNNWFNSLIKQFKKNNKSLKNIDKFNFVFLTNDLIPIKEENNKKHFDNNLSMPDWNIQFTYGSSLTSNKLYYIPLASTNNNSVFYIEKK